MKYLLTLLLSISVCAEAIIIRHDVADAQYKVPSTELPQLATFYFDGAHGTLIAPTWVLTAAHATFCVKPNSSIRLNAKHHTVKRVYVHKDYTPGRSHDIALIELQQPVLGVTPFSLNTKSDELNKNLWFIGIGGTGNGLTGQTVDNFENKGQMRKAQNTVTLAQGPLLKFTFDKGDNALALEGVSGGGDSGGPAYTFQNNTGVIYGISSRVEGGNIGKYGVSEVYSRTSFFAPWINKIINGKNIDALSDAKLKQLPAGLTEDILPRVCNDIRIK